MFLFIVKYTNDIEFTLEKINMLEMPSYFLFGVSKIFPTLYRGKSEKINMLEMPV